MPADNSLRTGAVAVFICLALPFIRVVDGIAAVRCAFRDGGGELVGVGDAIDLRSGGQRLEAAAVVERADVYVITYLVSNSFSFAEVFIF